jgi:hypothetical protein
MKNTPAKALINRVKDVVPELDDVRSIVINNESPTPYDITLIEGMASHFLTTTEICSVIRMTHSRFEKHLELQAAYQRGVELGKATLRRMQWISAKSNPFMQIFLGKQYLGQSDLPKVPQGESQSDAFKGFLDKLSIVINVSPESSPAPKVIGTGTGDSPTFLETVGENSATPTDSGPVVTTGKDDHADRGVGKKESRRSFHRLVEDMVVSSGERVG